MMRFTLACAAVVMLLAAITACGLLSPKTAIDTGNAIACVEREARAGSSVAQIAVACGLDVADVMTDILLSKDPAVAKAPAYGESRKARAKMQALPPDRDPQSRLPRAPEDDWIASALLESTAPLIGPEIHRLRVCTLPERALAHDLGADP